MILKHHLSTPIRKVRLSPMNQGGRPVEISLWKRAGCQTELKALEKLIVVRVVGEPSLGLLNPFEMD